MNRLDTFFLNLRYAFRPRKPLLLIRLAEALFRASFPGNARLRYVDFSIGFACNLTCEHCFATNLRNEGRRTLTLDDYGRIAQEAMDLGAVNFSFQGGEPLLFNSLYEIIAACRPERNLISVTTNGTLLTSERVKSLKKAGVDILTVSLDSANPEEHDNFRGQPGAHAKALAGIDLALEHGLRVTLGAVVTHQNLHSSGISGLVDFATKKKVLLYLIFPVAAGRWTENQTMLLTQEDQDYIQRLTRKTAYVRTDFQANLKGFGCGAGKEILYLTPYGDVLVCPFLHITPGNVFEEPLADIRQRALQLKWFSSYHQRCLVSTDAEFIEKHLSRTFAAEQLPLRWDQAFPPEEK